MTGDLQKMEPLALAEWQRRGAQQLLDQWLAVGRRIGSMDNATIMTAAANLAAYLLCQHGNLTLAQQNLDVFATHIREIVTTHYEEKNRHER